MKKKAIKFQLGGMGAFFTYLPTNPILPLGRAVQTAVCVIGVAC